MTTYNKKYWGNTQHCLIIYFIFSRISLCVGIYNNWITSGVKFDIDLFCQRFAGVIPDCSCFNKVELNSGEFSSDDDRKIEYAIRIKELLWNNLNI